jgi:phosphoadenosine phosphosulfate reductase
MSSTQPNGLPTDDRPLPDPVLAAELAAAAERLDGAPAEEIIRWSFERFGPDCVVATSYQDPVLVDLVVRAVGKATVVFLDTKAHFAETLLYMKQLEELLGLETTILQPGPDAENWPCGTDRCCEFRKVRPLRRFLADKPAWITGIKRVDTPERAKAPVVSWDSTFGLAKVNPLAAWTEDDIDAYMASRGLPAHPLWAFGYRSIGCAPTTSPIAPGADPRRGRWGGAKTECGLHLPPSGPKDTNR